MTDRNDVKEGVAFAYQTFQMSKEIFNKLIQDYLASKGEKQGEVKYSTLVKKAGGELDNIRVTDTNIGEFQATARKYDINYALKRDNTTEPPTWYVFFQTDKRSKDAIENAFKEYTEKQANRQEPVLLKENIKNVEYIPPQIPESEKEAPEKETKAKSKSKKAKEKAEPKTKAESKEIKSKEVKQKQKEIEVPDIGDDR